MIARTTAMLAVLGVTVVGASAQGPISQRFVVRGLVVLGGGEGSAWLQEPSLTGNQTIRVRRGDSVGPWRVTSILEDGVEIQGPAGSVTYLILRGVSAPDASRPVEAPSGPAADQARALTHLLETGGDEGVWDDAAPSAVPPPLAHGPR